jgi:hypothetical protein
MSAADSRAAPPGGKRDLAIPAVMPATWINPADSISVYVRSGRAVSCACQLARSWRRWVRLRSPQPH